MFLWGDISKGEGDWYMGPPLHLLKNTPALSWAKQLKRTEAPDRDTDKVEKLR